MLENTTPVYVFSRFTVAVFQCTGTVIRAALDPYIFTLLPLNFHLFRSAPVAAHRVTTGVGLLQVTGSKLTREGAHTGAQGILTKEQHRLKNVRLT